jgi:uncharacterized repeat protein (TIGR01451 family)
MKRELFVCRGATVIGILAVVALTPCPAWGQFPDLSITGEGWVGPAFSRGDLVLFQMTITNEGSATAHDLRVVDTLPENTSYVSAGGGYIVQAGPTQVVMVRERLEPLEQFMVLIAIRVAEDAPLGVALENHAAVLCLDPELRYDNNEVAVPAVVWNPGSVTGTKTVSGQFTSGGEVVYTVVLSNPGPESQTDGVGDEFVDHMPGGVALVDALVIAGGGTVVADMAGNTVTWNGSISAGGTVTLEIRGTVTPAIENQGFVNVDSNGDGTYDAQRPTDDPSTPEPDDATMFELLILGAVPAVTGTGLIILVAVLLATGVALIQRLKSS